MEVRTAAAIEIGSSKIKGAVAEFCSDGRINVLAVAEVHADNAVRYGRVQNVREVSAAVGEVIRHLENNPAVAPRQIQALTISLGGRSLSGALATANKQFSKEIEINEQTVQSLRAEAEKDFLGSKNIEAVIARKYYVNNVAVNSAVGTVGISLRGDYLLLTCARENRQNLERLKFDTIRPENVKYKLLALAQADMVLSNDERQLGCALVDFGAETTTISIYKDGTLTFLSTLPIGSRLITKDLMAGLTLTEAVAEDLKIKQGNVSGKCDENITADEVNNYVCARAGEIAANIVNQLNISGVGVDNLGAGIVLIGGGSDLVGFDTLLAAQTHLTVRKGTLPANVKLAGEKDGENDNIGIVSLLLAADDLVPGLSTPELTDDMTDNTTDAIDNDTSTVESEQTASDELEDDPTPVITIDEHHEKPYIDDDHLMEDDPEPEDEEETEEEESDDEQIDTRDNSAQKDRMKQVWDKLHKASYRLAKMFQSNPFDDYYNEDKQ